MEKQADLPGKLGSLANLNSMGILMITSFFHNRLNKRTLLSLLAGFVLLAVGGTNGAAWAQTREMVLYSLTPMVNQRVVTRFNLANSERIRQRQTALSCMYMQDCQPGCDACGSGPGDYVDETTIRGQMGACSSCQATCAPCGPSSFYCGGGFWFQNYGDFLTQQERLGLQAYHADSYGLSLGYDLVRRTDLLLGVGVGGAFSEAKVNDSEKKMDTDSFLLSLYGARNYCTWNLLGSIGYVHSAFESRRFSRLEPDQYLFGKHHGKTIFGSFEMSWVTMQHALGITPFLAYDFIRMEENAWGENTIEAVEPGDIAAMNKRRSTSYLQTLGFRFERSYYESCGWLVQPSFSLGWLHDYGQRRITTTGATAGQPFSYKGVVMNKNRFVTSLGVTVSQGCGTSLFVRYDGEFNRRYNAQTVQFGFGLGY